MRGGKKKRNLFCLCGPRYLLPEAINSLSNYFKSNFVNLSPARWQNSTRSNWKKVDVGTFSCPFFLPSCRTFFLCIKKGNFHLSLAIICGKMLSRVNVLKMRHFSLFFFFGYCWCCQRLNAHESHPHFKSICHHLKKDRKWVWGLWYTEKIFKWQKVCS